MQLASLQLLALKTTLPVNIGPPGSTVVQAFSNLWEASPSGPPLTVEVTPELSVTCASRTSPRFE